MNFVDSMRKQEGLADTNESGDESMISEENIVKINLPCLIAVNEVAIGVIDGVEEEACQVHGNKIEIHSFDTV